MSACLLLRGWLVGCLPGCLLVCLSVGLAGWLAGFVSVWYPALVACPSVGPWDAAAPRQFCRSTAMACAVLPSPISSPRMQRPWRHTAKRTAPRWHSFERAEMSCHFSLNIRERACPVTARSTGPPSPQPAVQNKEFVIMLAIRAPRLSRRDFCCGCGSSVLSQSERPRLARRPGAAAALAGRAGTRGTPPTGRRERAACRSISWGIGDPLWCAKASWSHQLSPG